MAFTEEEIAYLRSQPLARLSTLGPGGQPDVIPVALEWDGEFLWVGGGETISGEPVGQDWYPSRKAVH